MSDKDSEVDVRDNNKAMDSLTLPLGDENGSFTFYSVEELQNFVETERDRWAWMNSVPTPWNVLSKHLKRQIVDVVLNMLSSIISGWKDNNIDEMNERRSQLENVLHFINFPFSCRKVGEAIDREYENSKLVAVNMLYLCSAPKEGTYSGEVKTIAQQFAVIAQASPNGRPTPIFKAFIESEVYRCQANRILTKVELFGAGVEVEDLAVRLREASGRVTDIQKECEESFAELEAWKRARKEEYAEWVAVSKRNLRDIGRRVLRKIVSLKTEYIRRSSDVLKESEDTVLNAKEVYLSQVELDAAVTYWDGKKKSHKDSKDMWLKVLVVLLVITSISPFLIMKYLPVGDMAIDNLLFNSVNPIMLITSLLVISLLSFAIRLCSKQFSTQQHLFLEAEERKTMLKTYLALMKEGKLVEQEDRKIALDSLFRPAQTGMIAEHGNIVPSDSVIKIFERQSPSART